MLDSPILDLEEVKYDFEKNGDCDETFYEKDDHWYNGTHKRKPLATLQPKTNKYSSKKAQKLAKTQKANVSSNTVMCRQIDQLIKRLINYLQYCRFCENNEEPAQVFNSHSLRDGAGRLTCPRLRKYVCPICHASGDNTHNFVLEMGILTILLFIYFRRQRAYRSLLYEKTNFRD